MTVEEYNVSPETIEKFIQVETKGIAGYIRLAYAESVSTGFSVRVLAEALSGAGLKLSKSHLHRMIKSVALADKVTGKKTSAEVDQLRVAIYRKLNNLPVKQVEEALERGFQSVAEAIQELNSLRKPSGSKGTTGKTKEAEGPSIEDTIASIELAAIFLKGKTLTRDQANALAKAIAKLPKLAIAN